MTTNITEEHRRAFEALTSGRYRSFALFSCALDGSPAAAIVTEPEYLITRMFVSVTPAMTLTDHDGRKA